MSVSGAVEASYATKTDHYFAGARKAFVDDLPENPEARFLEIGCGNGDTAAYAKETRKCGYTAGVELVAEPAAEAASRMDQVITGDIEQLELPFGAEEFDVLVLSEVLEHLRDPWAVLRKLHPHLKPGAIVLAGSPNVAHHSVLRMLLRGRWDLDPSGVMDRTHLRWFTPATYRALFEDCGYAVERVGPPAELRPKARTFDRVTGGRLRHVLHSQIALRARRS